MYTCTLHGGVQVGLVGEYTPSLPYPSPVHTVFSMYPKSHFSPIPNYLLAHGLLGLDVRGIVRGSPYAQVGSRAVCRDLWAGSCPQKALRKSVHRAIHTCLEDTSPNVNLTSENGDANTFPRKRPK